MSKTESTLKPAGVFSLKAVNWLLAVVVFGVLVASGASYLKSRRILLASERACEVKNHLLELVHVNNLIQQMGNRQLDDAKEALNHRLSAGMRDVQAELAALDPRGEASASEVFSRITKARSAHPEYYGISAGSTVSNATEPSKSSAVGNN